MSEVGSRRPVWCAQEKEGRSECRTVVKLWPIHGKLKKWKMAESGPSLLFTARIICCLPSWMVQNAGEGLVRLASARLKDLSNPFLQDLTPWGRRKTVQLMAKENKKLLPFDESHARGWSHWANRKPLTKQWRRMRLVLWWQYNETYGCIGEPWLETRPLYTKVKNGKSGNRIKVMQWLTKARTPDETDNTDNYLLCL